MISRVALVLTLLLEVIVFHRNILLRFKVIPWDIRTYHLPQALFVAKALRDGELPLWNPYIYCGHPFAANIQTALFYPPRLLATLCGGVTAEAMLYSLEIELLLHVFLGGAFCYLLLRELGMNRPLSLLGASSFQLGPFFTSQAEHLGAIEGMSWLPAVWLLIFRLVRKTAWLDALLLSAALSMTVLSGFTPVTAVIFLSTGFLAGTLVITRRARPMLLGVFAGCCAAVALLCAMVLLPGAELALASVSRFRSDWIGNGGGLPLDSLRSLVWPNSHRVLEPGEYRGSADITLMYLYSGIVTVAGAAAFLLKRRFRVAPAVAVVLAVSALFMLGTSTPFGWLYGSVFPAALRGVIYPQEWIGPFSLSLCLLGAYGIAGLTLSRGRTLALAAVAVFDLTLFGSNRPFNSVDPIAEPGVSEGAFAGSTALLANVRSLTNKTNPPARIDSIGDSIDWVGSAMITEVPTAGGEDPLALIRAIQVRLAFAQGARWGYYYQANTVQSPVLEALNVCCVVTRSRLSPRQLTGSSYRTETEVPGGYIYSGNTALPRFYLVPRTLPASNLEEAVRLLKQPAWKPDRSAIAEGYAGFPISAAAPALDSVSIRRYLRNSVSLETYSAAATFLASSEANYPGWEAKVDGRAARIYNTNVAFRGLPLPAGRHIVEFQFAPAIAKWSLALSLGAWAALAAAAVRVRKCVLLH